MFFLDLEQVLEDSEEAEAEVVPEARASAAAPEGEGAPAALAEEQPTEEELKAPEPESIAPEGPETVGEPTSAEVAEVEPPVPASAPSRNLLRGRHPRGGWRSGAPPRVLPPRHLPRSVLRRRLRGLSVP